MPAQELPGELAGFGIFERNAARMVLGVGAIPVSGTLSRRAPPVCPHYRHPPTRARRHYGERAHPDVERAFEEHESAEIRDATGQLRAAEKHREWPLNGTAALDNRSKVVR